MKGKVGSVDKWGAPLETPVRLSCWLLHIIVSPGRPEPGPNSPHPKSNRLPTKKSHLTAISLEIFQKLEQKIGAQFSQTTADKEISSHPDLSRKFPKIGTKDRRKIFTTPLHQSSYKTIGTRDLGHAKRFDQHPKGSQFFPRTKP